MYAAGRWFPKGEWYAPTARPSFGRDEKSRPQRQKVRNAYEPIDRCIDLLGDHGHSGRAGHAHQAHPQQAGGAVL